MRHLGYNGKRLLALFMTAALFISCVPAVYAESVEADIETVETGGQKELRLWYDTPVTEVAGWDSREVWQRNTLPIGNGYQGVNIYGGIAREQLQLSEESLWTGGPVTPIYDDEGTLIAGLDRYWGNGDFLGLSYGVFSQVGTAANAQHVAIEPNGQYIPDTMWPAARDAALGDNNNDIIRAMSPWLPNKRSAMGCYQNFAQVYFDFVHDGNPGVAIEDMPYYTRDLDIGSAVAGVRYVYNGVSYKREYIASYPDHVVAVRLTADDNGKISFTFSPQIADVVMSNLGGATYAQRGQHNVAGGYDRTAYGKAGCYVDSEVNDGIGLIEMGGYLRQNGLEFAAQFTVIPDGGAMTSGTHDVTYSNSGNSAAVRQTHTFGNIKVEGADSVVILMSYGTDYKQEYPAYRTGKPAMEPVAQRMSTAVAKGWDNIFEDHVADYQELFSRVELDLGGEGIDKPTDDALYEYKLYEDNKSLEELYFQYGRYLLISSSRPGSLPANLQGVWNMQDQPDWQSGYTVNQNFEMNYWPSMNTNLLETAEPMVTFIEALREPGRVTAEKIYGVESGLGEANGWSMNHNTNIYGFTGFLHQTVNASGYALWSPGSGAWVSQSMYDYYQFSGDKEVLAKTIYPTIKEASLFFTKVLIRDPVSGRMVMSPSYSPEHGGMFAGSTFDQELIWQLFKETAEAADILGVDAGLSAELKALMAELDPLHKTGSGAIKEWYQDWAQSNNGSPISLMSGYNADTNVYTPASGGSGVGINDIDPKHRHVAHLVGLYPGNHITADNPEWMEAAIQTLEERGDDGTGWAKAHKLNLWARAQDGNRAYKMYTGLLTHSTYDNLWDAHPPFQIDGNLGGTAGLAEMLLQSHAGYIQPLPALPDAWADGSVKGLVAQGNFVVDMSWNYGDLGRMEITSRAGGDCVVKYDGVSNAIITDSDGNTVEPLWDSASKTIFFPTQAAKTYYFVMDEAKVELNRLLKTADGLKLIRYTPSTAGALNAAAISAKDYLESGAGTAADVLAELRNAINNLAARSGISINTLVDTIRIAEITLRGGADSSASSIAAIQSAADDSRALLHDPEGTQAQIDQAVDALNIAMNGQIKVVPSYYLNENGDHHDGTRAANETKTPSEDVRYWTGVGNVSSNLIDGIWWNGTTYGNPAAIQPDGTPEPGNQWSRSNFGAALGGNLFQNSGAQAIGAAMEADFYGVRIQYYTLFTKQTAIIRVYLDGEFVADIEPLEGASDGPVKVAFDSADYPQFELASGQKHTIRLECLRRAVNGTANTSNGDVRFRSDGYQIFDLAGAVNDKSALRESIIRFFSADESSYQPDTWQWMQSWYETAVGLLANPNAGQSDLDFCAEKLNKLLDDTVKLSVGVTVTTPIIVETLAANLMVSVSGEGLEGKELTAYLSVNGELSCETPVLDGKAILRIAAAPTADASCLVAVMSGDGSAYGEFAMTLAEYKPAELWAPKASMQDGIITVEFSEKVSPGPGGYGASVEGKSYEVGQSGDKALTVAVDPDEISEGKVSISGVKYTDMFPSFSFTFTVAFGK